jgi:hypothetical protein
MASEFIMNTISGYVKPVVDGAVSTAGGFAGDLVGGVGTGINGVGSAVESTVRGYGDSTINYGNAIKDYTGATGPRKGTTTNPLGLSNTKDGAKRDFYNTPKNATYKKPVTRSQSLPAATQPKALPAPAVKKPVNASNTAGRFAKPKTTTPTYKPPQAMTATPTYKPPQAKPTALTARQAAVIPGVGAKKTISLESMPEHRQKKAAGAARRKAANTAAKPGAAK